MLILFLLLLCRVIKLDWVGRGYVLFVKESVLVKV
ncbi:hypothetical protein [Scopulibacillus cellulosilyticus]|uniref:Uncharacterized protein n=1 Tax=Scopulibacillus cellulosilyticus TaxID=2665665 RepID=A0ABW2PW75_9BACL